MLRRKLRFCSLTRYFTNAVSASAALVSTRKVAHFIAGGNLREAEAMPRILVVDSDPLICEMVSGHLWGAMRAYVDSAQTPRDGALLLKGYQFDLAVIEAGLPNISGLQLAELAANENTAVLLTCGHPAIHEKFNHYNLPHLSKPFDLDALVEEATWIIQDTQYNISRVRAAAAEMLAQTAALAVTLEESRRLMATITTRESTK
jgi:DNA-binding response OmpR family regulator